MWQAVQTQWRATGFSIIGLDYGVIDRVAGIMDIELTLGLLKKIQALEHAALETFRKHDEPQALN